MVIGTKKTSISTVTDSFAISNNFIITYLFLYILLCDFFCVQELLELLKCNYTIIIFIEFLKCFFDVGFRKVFIDPPNETSGIFSPTSSYWRIPEILTVNCRSYRIFWKGLLSWYYISLLRVLVFKLTGTLHSHCFPTILTPGPDQMHLIFISSNYSAVPHQLVPAPPHSCVCTNSCSSIRHCPSATSWILLTRSCCSHPRRSSWKCTPPRPVPNSASSF